MATKTATGVPASDLEDSALERELEHLHETRHETFMNGSSDALEAHTERMLELEQEYARRFPNRTAPDQLRTREGSREADGRG
ncbi:MAG TPA: DUF6158 family protein [Frankiaceae bacterium]|jgi:hypothetical protein|nr:DUF6158 family protein [Frankiaceae bacterium]